MFKTILLVALFGVTFVHGQTAIIINRLVELRSKIFISLLLLFGAGLPCSAMAAPHEPAAADTVRFVDDVSLFDAVYPAFRKLYVRFARYEASYDTRFDSHLTPDFPSRGRVEPYDRTERERAVCLRYARELAAVRDSLFAQPGFDLDAEKTRLVRQLETFGDTASALPTVYAQIATDYGGDVRAYVDDLFAHSVMTDERRMRRFVRHPTYRKMQADMGFQLVVSKLLYRHWEAQGRPAEGVGHYVIRNLWRTPEAEH